MTPERARELLPIIAAFAEGKDIQFQIKDMPGRWHLLSKGLACSFDSDITYRIKPESKLRPFTQAEAIRFRLFRYSTESDAISPCAFTKSCLIFNRAQGGEYAEYLERGWQCSIDGVTWQACGVEVTE